MEQNYIMTEIESTKNNMEKKQFVVYSSGKWHDYEFVIKSNFLPQNIWNRFSEQIQGSVRTDNIPDSLNPSRWLYSKIENYSLFGIATYNAQLASDCKYAIDYTGNNRSLRIFIGIVCEGKFQNLPMDLELFKSWYMKLIEPQWELPIGDPNYIQVGLDVNETLVCNNLIYPNTSVNLNCNSRVVRFLNGGTSVEDCMASALSAEGDIACMGMIKENHKGFASMSKYHYNNVIVEGQTMDEDVQLKEEKPKHEEKKEVKNSLESIGYNSEGFNNTDNNDNDDRSKRERLKKAITSVALVILLLVLLVVLLLKKK